MKRDKNLIFQLHALHALHGLTYNDFLLDQTPTKTVGAAGLTADSKVYALKTEESPFQGQPKAGPSGPGFLHKKAFLCVLCGFA